MSMQNRLVIFAVCFLLFPIGNCEVTKCLSCMGTQEHCKRNATVITCYTPKDHAEQLNQERTVKYTTCTKAKGTFNNTPTMYIKSCGTDYKNGVSACQVARSSFIQVEDFACWQCYSDLCNSACLKQIPAIMAMFLISIIHFI